MHVEGTYREPEQRQITNNPRSIQLEPPVDKEAGRILY